jgi:uncharacterized protein (TIGR02001 family)
MIRTCMMASLFIAASGAAHAQDSRNPWSFALGAATDNRSKDASKSDGDPYVWGEAQWESASGLFYAGPQFETIKSSTGSELEVALSAGLRPQIAGFDLDLNAEHKWHVDADAGTDDAAWEFTADVKRSIGPASARVRLQHSPDSTGSTKAWTWVALRGGWDFTNKLTATVEIGRREQDNSIDYTGWNAGLTYALTRNLEAELRYHATDADVPGEQYADALVAGVSVAF